MTRINGHDIVAETIGIGQPAVMIHCMLARYAALLPLAEALPYRTTLFDLPGHGRSGDWDGKVDYQKLVVTSAASFCDGPTHIIGHSFGATAALRLAVTRPDLVSRLTLIEPVYFAAAKGTAAHAAHIRDFRPFVRAMLAGDESGAAEVFNELWGDKSWSDLSLRRRAYLTARIHLIVAGATATEEDPEGITSPETLGGLNIPVSLIRGENSPDIVGAIHEVLTARIPDAVDHVIEGAGHMLPMPYPKQVAAIIRAEDREIA